MNKPLLSARAFLIILTAAAVGVLVLPVGGPPGAVLTGIAVATGLNTLVGK